MKIILQSLHSTFLILDKMKVIKVEAKGNLVFYFFQWLGYFWDFVPIKIVFTPIYPNNLELKKKKKKKNAQGYQSGTSLILHQDTLNYHFHIFTKKWIRTPTFAIWLVPLYWRYMIQWWLLYYFSNCATCERWRCYPVRHLWGPDLPAKAKTNLPLSVCSSMWVPHLPFWCQQTHHSCCWITKVC